MAENISRMGSTVERLASSSVVLTRLGSPESDLVEGGHLVANGTVEDELGQLQGGQTFSISSICLPCTRD